MNTKRLGFITLMTFFILAVLGNTFHQNKVLASQDVVDAATPFRFEQPSKPEGCKAALVMEVSSGDIIYELNSHDQLQPASMVKMMLILITMEKVKSGQASLDDLVTVSAAASKIGGSQVYLKHGEEFSLEKLLQTVCIQSANDSSYAIAEHLAGSAKGFIDLMNARAGQLGMTGTVFNSTNGLPPGKNQEADLTTAHDLGLLAREIVLNHPEILQWTSLDTLPFRDGTFIMTNTNRLVRQMEGCDGLKTGYFREAGFSITATATRNGVRIITVVMGCEKGKERFSEAARLLRWGLSLYQRMDLIVPGFLVEKNIPVVDGEKTETWPVAQMGLQAVIPNGRIDDIIMKTTLEKELIAPIDTGLQCGSIEFYLDDRLLGTTPLITNESIEALSWFGKLKRLLVFW